MIFIIHTTYLLLHELVHAHHGAAHSSRFELSVPGMRERLDAVVLLGVDEHVVERSFLETSGPANAAVGAFAEILLRHTKRSKQPATYGEIFALLRYCRATRAAKNTWRMAGSLLLTRRFFLTQVKCSIQKPRGTKKQDTKSLESFFNRESGLRNIIVDLEICHKMRYSRIRRMLILVTSV